MNKKRMRLGSKLVIYYLTATLVFLLLIGLTVNKSIQFYGIRTVEDQLIKQVKSSLDYIKQTLYFENKSSISLNPALTDKLAGELSAGNREIRLYDDDLNLQSGYIDGIKQDPLKIKTFYTNLNIALKGEYAYKIDGEAIYFAAPINFRERAIGVLEIIYPLGLLNEILSKVTYVLVIAGIMFSTLIIFLSFYLAKITVSPIKKLVEISEQYSKQNFVHIDIEGTYEIDKLSKSISKMGEKIQGYIDRQRQFVSNVSHELRTPLTAIKGYSEFLSEEIKGDSDIKKAIYHLNNETERLYKMVSELLLLSRIDVDSEGYYLEPMNLTELLKKILDSIKIRLDKEEITLQEDLQSNLYITGDNQKLSQVMINIIDNSIKYSQKPGKIEVKLYKKNDSIVISVKDMGVGIPKDELDKVFDRFYRATNTKAYKGTGLGLAISNEIVRAHDGYIEIESEKDKGTTLKIVLPEDKLLQD